METYKPQAGTVAGFTTAAASIAAASFGIPVELAASLVGGIFMLFNDSSFGRAS